MVRVCACVCCTVSAPVLHLQCIFSTSPDSNNEETAVAAYWVTDAVDRCWVGFLPRHYILQATLYDGRLVQVVAMLAESDIPRQRQYSRFNCGACHAVIIDGSHQMIECTATRRAARNSRDGESVRAVVAPYVSAVALQNRRLHSYHKIAADVFAGSQSDKDSAV